MNAGEKKQKTKESEKVKLNLWIMGSLETGRLSGRGQQVKQKWDWRREKNKILMEALEGALNSDGSRDKKVMGK